MQFGISPQCAKCKHLYDGPGVINGKKWACVAFPEGIPLELVLGARSHTRLYKGDGGIRFEEVEAPRRSILKSG